VGAAVVALAVRAVEAGAAPYFGAYGEAVAADWTAGVAPPMDGSPGSVEVAAASVSADE
jgi:hypothetical protein